MTAVDVHGYGNESSVYAYRVHDNTRPVVIIQEPATISKTVTSKPSIAISGHTIDAGNAGLKSITCNTGEPNLGTLEHWSFDVSLHHGANEIIIIAEDKNGKLGSDTIEITRALQPEPPGFSPAAPLSFENQLTVSISTAEKNMVIHYTTDGTEPTAASKIYSSPILIKETTTFKAKSFTEDGMPSPVSVATYTLVPKKKADVHKHLTLQVAAFKDKAFADDLVSTLKAKGYPAYSVVGTSPENVTYYKVRLGFFGERVDAENMLEKMKEENLKAIIVNTTVSE
jgi:cell division septation protein DedD